MKELYDKELRKAKRNARHLHYHYYIKSNTTGDKNNINKALEAREFEVNIRKHNLGELMDFNIKAQKELNS